MTSLQISQNAFSTFMLSPKFKTGKLSVQWNLHPAPWPCFWPFQCLSVFPVDSRERQWKAFSLQFRVCDFLDLDSHSVTKYWGLCVGGASVNCPVKLSIIRWHYAPTVFILLRETHTRVNKRMYVMKIISALLIAGSWGKPRYSSLGKQKGKR